MKIQPIKLLPWFLTIFFATLFIANYQARQQNANISPTPTPTISPTASPAPKIQPTKQTFLVTKIIDGDTIEVEGGIRVRLLGIDSPEEGQCFYQEAKDYLFSQINNRRVTLEKDVQEFDKYGRTLAYVWLDNILINQTMVDEGFAKLLTIPPDVKYVDQLTKAQTNAREKGLGLWSPNACITTPSPSTTPIPQVQSTNTACVIKGNISSSGEKIYHMPGQRYYEKTKIDEAKGERWFCSEEEAVSAGWRKSKL